MFLHKERTNLMDNICQIYKKAQINNNLSETAQHNLKKIFLTQQLTKFSYFMM